MVIVGDNQVVSCLAYLDKAGVPTLVPKPASPTVTQENPTIYKFTVLRALGLPCVTSGHAICSLKIRMSVPKMRGRRLVEKLVIARHCRANVAPLKLCTLLQRILFDESLRRQSFYGQHCRHRSNPN